MTDDGAAAFLPEELTLDRLRHASKGCHGCPLWRLGSQTVFGEGPVGSALMVVGEQPGDKEDLAGRPFVGPAGRVFDEALTEVGIEREVVYVTNAVKHFKFERRGKLRLHKKPSSAEIDACKPWLMTEIATVRPRIVLCLGATAAQALLGRSFRVLRDHGTPSEGPEGTPTIGTIHPSAILRATDPSARIEQRRLLLGDLRIVRRMINELAPGAAVSGETPTGRPNPSG